MAEAFPRTLSLLRKERGISQRSAAEALHVSQALLSHYENGAREPSYDFLIRAASYYHVSTDYLLGLTMSRERSEDILLNDTPRENEQDPPPKLKLLANSISLVYDLMHSIRNTVFNERVEEYLILAVYKVFRYLYMSYPGTKDELFSVPFSSFSELVDIEMKRAELEIKLQSGILANARQGGSGMSYDLLKQKYPDHSRYAMSLLYDAGEYLMPNGEKHEHKKRT